MLSCRQCAFWSSSCSRRVERIATCPASLQIDPSDQMARERIDRPCKARFTKRERHYGSPECHCRPECKITATYTTYRHLYAIVPVLSQQQQQQHSDWNNSSFGRPNLATHTHLPGPRGLPIEAERGKLSLQPLGAKSDGISIKRLDVQRGPLEAAAEASLAAPPGAPGDVQFGGTTLRRLVVVVVIFACLWRRT